jgi:hypothetical protein
MLHFVSVVLLLLGQVVDPKENQLNHLSQEGDVGVVGRHIELVRGKFLDNAANVRGVVDKNSAIMRNDYAVTTARADFFMFLIKGIDTTSWEVGDIKELPKPLKVTGWHKYKSGGRTVEVQILVPVPKPK